MSKTLDERIVSIQFDSQKFETNIAQAISSLNKLDETIAGLDFNNSIKNLGDKVGNIDLSGISDNLDGISSNMEKRFGAFGTFAEGVIKNLAGQATSFVTGKFKSVYDNTIGQIISGGNARAQSIEDAKFKLQGLLETEEDVADVMAQAQFSVSDTAYGLNEAVAAAAQLTAADIRGADLDTALKALAGTAATFNLDYGRLTEVFADIGAKAVVTGGDITRLSRYSIPAAAVMTDYFNGIINGSIEADAATTAYIKNITGGIQQTQADVKGLATDGYISFEIFSKSMENAFGSHAKDANKTVTGALANVRAALSRTGAAFKSPLIEQNGPLVQMYNTLRVLINGVNNELQPFVDVYVDAMTKIYGVVSKIAEFDEDTGTYKLLLDVKSLMEGFANILDTVLNLLAPVKEAFSTVFSGISIDSINTVFQKFEKFTEKLSLFSGAWKNGDLLREIDFSKLISGDPSAVLQLEEQLSDISIIQKSGEIYERIFDAFHGIFSVVSLAKDAVKGLWELIKNASGFLAPLGDQITTVFSVAGILLGDFAQSVRESGVIVDILSSIGTIISSVLSPIIRNVTELFRTLTDRLFEIRKDSDGLKTVLCWVGDAFKWVADVISKYFGPVIDFLFTIIGYAITGIEKFVGAIIFLKDKLEEGVTKAITPVLNFFSSLKDKTSPARIAIDNFRTSVSNLWTEFKNSKLSKIASGFSNIFGAVRDAIKSFKDNLKSAFSFKDTNVDASIDDVSDKFLRFNEILEVVLKAVKWVSDKVGEALGFISDKVSIALGFITEQIKKFSSGNTAKAIVTFFESIKEHIKSLKGKLENFKETFSNLWNEFKDSKLGKLTESFSKAFGTIKEVIGEVKDKLKSAFGKESNVTASVGETAGAFDGFLEIIKKVAGFITDKLTIAFDWLSDKLQLVKEKLTPVGEFFKKLAEDIGGFFKNIVSGDGISALGILEKIGEVLKTVFGAIFGVVGKVFDFLKSALSGIDLKGLVDLLLSILKGALFVEILSFVDKLGNVADSIAGFFDSFKKAKETGHMIRDIGIALLLMAAGMFAVSQIPADKMQKTIETLTIMLGGLYLIASKLQNTSLFSGTKTKNSGNTDIANAFNNNSLLKLPEIPKSFEINLKNISTKWLDIGAGIFLLAKGVKVVVDAIKEVIPLVNDPNIEKAAIGVGVIMAALAGSVRLAGKGSLGNLGNAAEFIALAFAVKMMVGIIDDLSKMYTGNTNALSAALTIAGIIIALGVAVDAAGKGSLRASIEFVAIALSVKIIAGVIEDLAAVYSKSNTALGAAITVGALMLVLGQSIWMAGKGSVGATVGVFAFAIAIKMIISTLMELAAFAENDLVGLIGSGILIAGLILALGISVKKAGEAGIGGAVGILAMAVALNMLIGPLQAMSSLTLGGVLACVVIMIAFAFAIVMVSDAINPLIISITAIIVAITAFMAVMILFGNSLSETGEAITERIDAFFDKLGEWAVRLGEMALLFIANFINGLAQGVGDLVASVINIIYQIAEALYQNKETLADAVYDLLMTVLQIVGTALGNILNNILEFFGMAKVDTGNWFTDLIGIIISGAARIIMAVVDCLTDILLHIFEFIILAPLYIAKFFAELLGINTDKLDQMIEDVKSFFSDIIPKIKEELAHVWEEVTGWFKNLWAKIKGIFKGKDAETGDIAEDAKEGMERVSDAMDEGLDEERIEDSARGVSDAVETNIDNDGQLEEAVEEKGEDVIEGFGSAFDLDGAGVKDIFGNMEDIGLGSLDALDLNGVGGGLFGGAKETGSDLDDGFIKGINNGSGGVWNAATSIGQTALNALRTAIDAHSPSRITTNLGNFFGLGFAEGIDDGAEDAMHSAEAMGDSAISILKEALSGLDALDTDNIENPVIKPVLDLSEIQNGSASIADILSGRYSVGLAGSIGSITGNRASSGNQDNSTTTINMTVNGAAGQDVNDLAEIVTRRINQQLRSRERVWA